MHLESCQTSDLQTTSVAITARPGLLHAIQLVPAAAASTVTIYDNATAASGKVLAKLAAVANGASVTLTFTHPVEYLSGLFASVSGASAGYIVNFSLM